MPEQVTCPQFNLLRPQEVWGEGVGPTFQRLDKGYTAYLSFLVPNNSFMVLRVKRGGSYYELRKVIQVACKEN